ncbi:MAG: FeoA family protein [Dissulfuribacterales bacterium]
MYLSEVKNGVVATVKHVDSGCGMYRRILELGILPGTKLKILQNIPHGPVVFEKNGSKMLLGRGMAQKIQVEY